MCKFSTGRMWVTAALTVSALMVVGCKVDDGEDCPSTLVGCPGYVNPGTSSYLVVNESMTWDEADAYAREQRGYLAVINNADEQTLVYDLITRDGDKNFYWLGGYRDGNTWKWVDGSAFSYTNWHSSQPDNYQNKQDKLMIMRVKNPKLSNTEGKWDDLSADGIISGESYFGINNKGFVIEWDE